MIDQTPPSGWTTASMPRGGYDSAWFDVLAKVEERHFWFRARNNLIAAAVGQVTEGRGTHLRVLEVGCGNGNVLRVLKQLCPDGVVVGLDLFEEGLNHARERCDCVLVPGDILEAPFADGSFDLIGMFDVLEHLPDDLKALRALHALLAPGGAVVLTVPACASLWSYFDEIGGHYRRYSAGELVQKLVETGFEVSYQTYFMFTIFPLVWAARCWRANRPGSRSSKAADPYARAMRELQIRPGVNELLMRLLSWETWWIRHRRRLPIGTSLLAVARKPMRLPSA
jgi:SAM-dependent methyltransferase